jgi:prepilin-type N-terminal cleavage/methylation domain-containing protein
MSSILQSSERRRALRNGQRVRGFTLIELVAVITIMGILMAAMGPRFWSNAVFNERGYADEVGAAIKYSQTIAAASDCAVQFTLDANNYAAMQGSTLPTCNGVVAWTTPVKYGDGKTVAGTTAPDVTMTAATYTLTFDRQGHFAGPTVTIPIGSSGVHSIQIQAPDGFVVVL